MAISTTYVPIESKTATGSASTITFSSIPSTYTDLVLVANSSVTSGSSTVVLRFNGDTGSNYCRTAISGNTSGGAYSAKDNNSSWLNLTNQDGITDTAGSYNQIISIQNYSSTNLYKPVLARSSNVSNGMTAAVGMWTNSSDAINSITVFTYNGVNFSSTSTFSLYGIAAAPNASANKATGGTISVRSGYTYHAFTSGATFTPSEDITADILLIAGGGGGGTYSGGGGGGGAGGVLLLANQSLTNGTAYTVSVGGGGAANTSGQNSYFGALTQAVGGGYGGSASIGGNGGSGGGASDTGFAAGTGTDGQGYRGGTGSGGGSSPGGGGGGSAEPGENAYGDNVPNIAGKGGSGTNIYYDWAAATSTGVSGYFAAGGGGGVYINSSFANNGGGAGGNGGGGSGGSSNKNATTNSGSGGGGGSYTSSPVAPGNGGSGLVIVRYAN